MENYRAIAISTFLNTAPDQTIRDGALYSVYKWRGHYYQVVPYKKIKKIGSKEDQFVKILAIRHFYGIRELSDAMLKKLSIDK